MSTDNSLAPPPTVQPANAPKTTAQLHLEDAQKFVNTLQKMREEKRGQLAQLKRNVGEPLPGRGTSWFYSLLYQGDSDRRIKRGAEYFLIATLYDLNRYDSKGAPNLGASMKMAIVKSGANQESAARRLQILLDADFDGIEKSELAFRLRQTVQWLNGQQTGINWAQLLVDLCSWSHPNRFVQKQLAKSFFDNPRAPQPTETTAS